LAIEIQSPIPLDRARPRVSIGLPVYNGERYLESAIRCILTQTFTNFELILSDNASTDGTEAIFRAAAQQDSRIRLYRSDENRGLAWNWARMISDVLIALFPKSLSWVQRIQQNTNARKDPRLERR
jgi:glycosyltransferase involved in cell wall biosynthesis